MAKRRSKQFLEEFQPPEKKLISDSEKLIKELSRKQCSTKITLAEQLAHKKAFEKGDEFVPITSCQSGESSVQQIQQAEKFLTEIEELKASGLCDEDINLYTVYQGDFNRLVSKHPFYEKQLLKDRMEAIEGTIKSYREKMDEIRSNAEPSDIVTPQQKSKSTAASLLEFANRNVKPLETLPHPMDDLAELNSDIDVRINMSELPTTITKIRRKARKLAARLQDTTKSNDAVVSKNHSSKWDVKTPTISLRTPIISEKKQYTCQKQCKYTVKDGEIMRLEDVRDVVCNGDKMSVADIISMPKFRGYSEGSTSNILYVKNLSDKVSEKDLMKILRKYVKIDVPFSIKILTGRMRGQAFLTFSDVNAAKRSLETLNGLMINGKPMVIQFGKRSADA